MLCIQEMVRFCVYFRIKPLGSTAGLPDGLFFWVSALRLYSPGKVMMLSLNYLHPSLTVRTTRVSNPVRSPHFRYWASVHFQIRAFAIGVHFHILPFYRYLNSSRILKITQDISFDSCILKFRGPQIWVHPLTHVLGPVQTLNARPFRITAAAGTEFAGTKLLCMSLKCIMHWFNMITKIHRFTTRWPSFLPLLENLSF